jgi:putative membrane protein
MTATSAPHTSADSTSLALSRTILAHDRTLMAWVRTSTSLISFGFTMYKFFQYLRTDGSAQDVQQLLGPRGVALLMIGIGVCALVVATIEYRWQMADLRRRFPAYGPFRRSVALALASTVSGLGVFGFVLVFLRR